jgi:hypothetical protein
MNGMNDGNYGGGPPDAPEMEPEATDDSEEEVGSKSALLSTSLLPPNPKVGDTFTIRVDSIFDSEVEVSVVSEETETPKTLSAADEIEAAAMGGE